MKNLKFTLMAFMALFLTFGFTSCGDDDKDEPTPSEKTGKSNVSAVVLISSDLINYFDGNLTFKVGNDTKTVTLKKGEGTKETLTTNYSLYRYTVTINDVTLSSSNKTDVSGILTFTRNSTEAPTSNFNFLNAAAVRIAATNAKMSDVSLNSAMSATGGIIPSKFESRIVNFVTSQTAMQDGKFLYNAGSDLSADFTTFIQNCKRERRIP